MPVTYMWTLMVAALLLAGAGTLNAQPKNEPLFPPLADGDVYIRNDLDGDASLDVKPERCERRLVKIPTKGRQTISCAGSAYVEVSFRAMRKDNTYVDKTVRLKTGRHYQFMWDTDFQSMTIGPMYDEQGRITR